MGLFTRKAEEPAPKRCPYCLEPVPEGARECTMCGRKLEAAEELADKVQGN